MMMRGFECSCLKQKEMPVDCQALGQSQKVLIVKCVLGSVFVNNLIDLVAYLQFFKTLIYLVQVYFCLFLNPKGKENKTSQNAKLTSELVYVK